MEKIQFLKDVEYIIIKPSDIVLTSSNIEEMYETKERRDQGGIDITISRILTQIGIPASLKGYRYIVTAVKEVLNDEAALEGVTKILYPQVAKKHNSTPQRVEKAIRHSIEVAWKKDNDCEFRREIRQSLNAAKARPTNSQFIALLSQHIRGIME